MSYITDRQIRELRDKANKAGDHATVDLCLVALNVTASDLSVMKRGQQIVYVDPKTRRPKCTVSPNEARQWCEENLKSF